MKGKKSIILSALSLAIVVTGLVAVVPSTASAQTDPVWTKPTITQSCQAVPAPGYTSKVAAKYERSGHFPALLKPVKSGTKQSANPCKGKGDVSVSFGWMVYVHLYHSDLGAWLWYVAGQGVGAAIATICPTFGPWVVVCAFVFAAATAYFVWYFQAIYNEGLGAVMEFNYDAAIWPWAAWAGMFAAPDSWT